MCTQKIDFLTKRPLAALDENKQPSSYLKLEGDPTAEDWNARDVPWGEKTGETMEAAPRVRGGGAGV
jgi:hypothetical protein